LCGLKTRFRVHEESRIFVDTKIGAVLSASRERLAGQHFVDGRLKSLGVKEFRCLGSRILVWHHDHLPAGRATDLLPQLALGDAQAVTGGAAKTNRHRGQRG